MTNVLIIHGTGGNPNENWFPWLQSELTKLGCNVFIPKFPTPKNQSQENWFQIFKKYKKYLNKDSLVIGHSLGPAFVLSVLESLDNPIKAAFFVAGFTGLLQNPKFDELNKTFISKKFDFGQIKKNCERFYVINSDNDPYVPIEQGASLAKYLGTDLIVLKNAGHINAEAGYTQFDFLLKTIIKEL